MSCLDQSWLLPPERSVLILPSQSMYSRVPECQVTTYYYVGFAYLMMRRYQDAIRVFANILLYIQRTKSMFQRTTYKYEMVRGRIGVDFTKEKAAVFSPAPPLSPDNLHLIVQPCFPGLCWW